MKFKCYTCPIGKECGWILERERFGEKPLCTSCYVEYLCIFYECTFYGFIPPYPMEMSEFEEPKEEKDV